MEMIVHSGILAWSIPIVALVYVCYLGEPNNYVRHLRKGAIIALSLLWPFLVFIWPPKHWWTRRCDGWCHWCSHWFEDECACAPCLDACQDHRLV